MQTPRRKWLAALALGSLLAAAGYARFRLVPQAEVGAGFVAKQLCSCLFVARRDAAACRLDLRPDLSPVRSEIEDGSVRAWVPLLASRTARFREGSGCSLE